MKSNQLILILASIIFITGVITNPNLESHKDAFNKKLHGTIQKSIKEDLDETDNDVNQAGAAIGFVMFGGASIDSITENMISSDNYLLFSLTRITWDEKSKIIGLGLFGNVFIFSDVENAIKEANGFSSSK